MSALVPAISIVGDRAISIEMAGTSPAMTLGVLRRSYASRRSAVGDPELVSVETWVVGQKRPRHLMMVGVEPDAGSEAEVHDGISDLACRLVRHHVLNPPEPIAIRSVDRSSFGIVPHHQPAVRVAVAGWWCG